MVTQEINPKGPSKQSLLRPETGQNSENNNGATSNNNNNNSDLFSPRFKSVAAMAGWDEEALLLASLVVEDTPERIAKQNKRSVLHFKTPPSNSRRKRRVHRRSPSLAPITVLNLDDEDESGTTNQGGDEKKKGQPETVKPEPSTSSSCSGSNSSSLPCMDRLREELSCAICLEICFEPSTTPCGHSFCKKCLRSAADKCGKKCPKCRQLISNGRSCTVNTVLWNTIQLLFPEEVRARKEAGVLNSREADRDSDRQSSERTSESNSILEATRRLRSVASRVADRDRQSSERTTTSQYNNGNRHVTRRLRPVGYSRRGTGDDDVGLTSSSTSTRRGVPLPSQDDDAALALRLQREEFMAIYRVPSSARDNLRAMAQRAISNRVRNQAV